MTQKKQLRIIGGQWRSRKIEWDPTTGIRPTTDRIRETVFNWLAPHIRGAYCLDAFAGSGILGFEALSRGAECVVFVDTNATAVRHIKKNAKTLNAQNCRILKATWPTDTVHSKPFDVVFLDPPFRKNLLIPCYQWLTNYDLLNDNSLIYIEVEKELDLSKLTQWKALREKTAGDVRYCLYQNTTDSAQK